MKYVVVLSDGMAGRPLEELDGRTTLEAADTPVWDELAKVSEIGTASMVPEGMSPGSDTGKSCGYGIRSRRLLYRAFSVGGIEYWSRYGRYGCVFPL